MSGQEQAGKGLPGQEKACLGRPVYETMVHQFIVTSEAKKNHGFCTKSSMFSCTLTI